MDFAATSYDHITKDFPVHTSGGHLKRLYLLRHAKSDWNDSSLSDIERPLSPRGVAAAPKVAEVMQSEGLLPELVICSPARRTRETWDLIGNCLDSEPPSQIDERLYLASPGELISLIQEQPDDLGSVMLIGHNPGMEAITMGLSGSGEHPDLDRALTKFPTGALAVIDLDVERWSDISGDSGSLRRFIRPRDLSTP
jgi:phosphohistidine phosphatase